MATNTERVRKWRRAHPDAAKKLTQQTAARYKKNHGVAPTTAYYYQHLELRLFKTARYRAAKNGLAFNLDVSDIVVPKRCPILGVELVRGGDGTRLGPHPYAPSLDRIVPTKGYVKGNVAVISFAANRIKLNLTEEHVVAFLAYLQSAKKTKRKRQRV